VFVICLVASSPRNAGANDGTPPSQFQRSSDFWAGVTSAQVFPRRISSTLQAEREDAGRIELEKLEIPARVNVTADFSEAALKTNANNSVIKSIDEFVARRRAPR
jgi:hypothetical protein